MYNFIYTLDLKSEVHKKSPYLPEQLRILEDFNSDSTPLSFMSFYRSISVAFCF